MTDLLKRKPDRWFGEGVAIYLSLASSLISGWLLTVALYGFEEQGVLYSLSRVGYHELSGPSRIFFASALGLLMWIVLFIVAHIFVHVKRPIRNWLYFILAYGGMFCLCLYLCSISTTW